MTEIAHLKEEIKEQEEEEDIFRLRSSLNRADNGVKLHRITVKSRTVARLKAELSALDNRRASA